MNFIERLQYFMEKKGINDNQMTVNAGLSVGLIGKAKVSGKGMSSMNIEKILLAYPDLSADWLLTGAGSMLKDDLNGIKTIDEANSSTLPTTSMNPSIGTPYYDVDFIGGFDEVFNSQVNIPATNIGTQNKPWRHHCPAPMHTQRHPIWRNLCSGVGYHPHH